MKAFLRLFPVLLSLVLLFTQCEKEGLYVYITDDNFLNALIEEGVDTDGDGLISNAEAEVVISLDVYGRSISDMTGIDKFVNLEALYCGSNQLTSLDISSCTALIEFSCGNNQLTSLEVSNNSALGILNVSDNQLTNLDISKNAALTEIDLSGNIDLSEVCVWTIPFPPVGYVCKTEGCSNVNFTTGCSQ